jgi:large subunit ribosomal protein L21
LNFGKGLECPVENKPENKSWGKSSIGLTSKGVLSIMTVYDFHKNGSSPARPGSTVPDSQERICMFAVLKTGGKQYKVSEGDVIQVEKLEANVGDSVTLDQVLMIGEDENVQVGSPLLEGAAVTGEVTDQFKGEKLIIFKKKRRKKYRNKNGHRQQLTRLKITGISK